jgi:hypothetical protein
VSQVTGVPVARAALVAAVLALLLPAAAFGWGGRYPTGDVYGSTVAIDVSDTYPVDETLPQTWATYLGTLVHGRELGRLTLDLEPLDEVQATCGEQALACYFPQSQTIHASPEDVLEAPSAREVVTHEYGHHVARNSVNASGSAEATGTERWSSYMNVCKRSVEGELFPGDEGLNYQENPGEAYAEAYRVLNLTKQGATAIGWEIVNRSLYPDARALALLEQDITTPWTGPTVTHWHGSFGNGRQRTLAVKTRLDGTFVARLHAPTRSRMQLALWAGGKVVARGTSVRYAICGQRGLTLRVERTKGSGSFTVDLSKP